MTPEYSDIIRGKNLSSQQGSAELIWAVMVGGEFYNDNHLQALGEERRDREKEHDDVNKTKLKGLV